MEVLEANDELSVMQKDPASILESISSSLLCLYLWGARNLDGSSRFIASDSLPAYPRVLKPDVTAFRHLWMVAS